MYKIETQLKLSDFVFPYGTLDAESDWVKLASIIPWDAVEQRYAKHFVNNGHPAHSARIALGSLIIKQRLRCSDEWTVKHVSENPYLQYFLGMKEYGRCPFGASTMVEFRKRWSENDIAEILEMTIPKPSKPEGDDQSNGGTLIMDATCCPADITYPQDINLLNETREKLEETIDTLCKTASLPKPRTYRKKARKDYLKFAKNRKRTTKQTGTAIKKQLQYIRRDIEHIEQLKSKGAEISASQEEYLNILTTVYEQQKYMYENKTHSVDDRIVSLAQPWVRPIVRGKAKAKTEFGAKLHISLVDGFARIERLSFDAYNESDDFFRIVERYHQRYGRYPERILADKIYRNRKTLAFCKEHDIRLTGPALGRPPKDVEVSKQAKKQEHIDICDRNAVEGTFGTTKTAYGLSRVAAKLHDTSFCVIGIALLCSNLQKRLRSLFCYFFSLFNIGKLHRLLIQN